MKAKISATELGRELASVLSRVRRQGESFLIEQDGEAVTTLEPLGASPGGTGRTLTNALRGLPDGDRDVAADPSGGPAKPARTTTNVRPIEPSSYGHSVSGQRDL
jgi:antitoxin (DNA-binding transcriptional repressor) of toxin-antitoxin stability system